MSACADSVVRGQALYRERIALPPDAVFEATLEDVSRPGAKAELIGTFRAEEAGPVPIRFEIRYDPTKIDERHAYSVRGRISAGGRLLFTTDQASPVLTRGHGNEVELLLVRVGATAPASGPAPFEDTTWSLVELSGSALSALPQTPHLVFAAEPRRVSGSGGCNRFAGEYERDGERLRLGPLASTRKACIHGMDTEVSFHAVLERVRSFRIAGRRLELLDDTGRILAVFEATAGEDARDPA